MTRRWITAGVVGLLIGTTALLVVAALRPDAPPRAPVAPISVGAIEVVGDTTWRWIGPDDCNADTDIIQVQRRTGEGEWFGTRVPLVSVSGITFSANGDDGVALGTSTSCGRQIAVTRDGGRTWSIDERNPTLVDAWWVDQQVWGVDISTGSAVVKPFRLIERRVPRIASLAADAEYAQPCDARDGVPSKVAFFTERTGLLLCEHRILTSRLIARTTDGGLNYERLTDDRSASGLDGDGTIQDFVVAGSENVWALFDDQECAEGQLRISDSQGQFFTRLPCLDGKLGVEKILGVTFTDARRGVMLAVGGNQPLMFETKDSGETWTPSAE